MSNTQYTMANVGAFSGMLLAAGMFLVLPCNVAAAPHDADSLYDAAVGGMDSVTVDEAIDQFSAVLAADREHAPAHFQLHTLQLRRWTPESRYQAEVHLQRAIRLDRRNAEYRNAWGELLWSQGFRERARLEYEELLAEDPDNLTARLFLARKSMMDYTLKHHQRGVSPKEKEELSSLALHQFFDCIALDPNLRDPYYGLALLYYEMDDPHQLLATAEDLRKRHPDDSNARLFSGLAYQELDDLDGAWEAYTEGLALMGFAARAVMESVEYIASGEEWERELGTRSPADTGSFDSAYDGAVALEAFWEPQDPLYLNDFNERRMEHYARVAYANLAYSQPLRNVEGWRTDPGKAYIKFGKPLNRSTSRGRVGHPNIPISALKDGWVYEDFKLEFLLMYSGNWTWKIYTGWWGPRDIFASLAFMNFGRKTLTTSELRRYVNAKVNDSFFEPLSHEILKDRQPRYVDPYEDDKYALPCQVVAFREGDRAVLEVASAVPRSRVGLSGPEGFVRLDRGLFVFDEGWCPLAREIDEVLELELAGDDSLLGGYLLSEHSVTVQPESHHIAVEVRDLKTGSIGEFRTLHEIVFSDTSLGVSDLLLASRIEPLSSFPESREDLLIEPNPLRAYPRAKSLQVYFEIYGLWRDPFGRTDYEISYEIGWPADDAGTGHLASLFLRELPVIEKGHLEVVVTELPVDARTEIETGASDGTGFFEDFGAGRRSRVVDRRVTYVSPEEPAKGGRGRRPREGRVWETAVTALYEGEREDDITYLSIDASQVPLGIHELRVSVTDRNSKETVRKKVLFVLLD